MSIPVAKPKNENQVVLGITFKEREALMYALTSAIYEDEHSGFPIWSGELRQLRIRLSKTKCGDPGCTFCGDPDEYR